MRSLYENDCYGWSVEQATLLRNKDFDLLDIDNLVEEILSVGKSQRGALESHLRVLLMHLLKMQYQPHMKTKSWELSVRLAKHHAMKVLRKNPGLKQYLNEILTESYEDAVLDASIETGIDIKTFPAECPWTLQEIFEVVE